MESSILNLSLIHIQMCIRDSGSTSLKTSASLAELIRRPELSYEALGEIDTERPNLPADVCEEVNINIKYAGYLERQMKMCIRDRLSTGVDKNVDKILLDAGRFSAYN